MDHFQPSPDDPDSENGAPPYRWLDEWLCEYVDGTMDPSLESVFEQYVEANPELQAHVQRLQKTRELLCNCASSPPPDPDTEEASTPPPGGTNPTPKEGSPSSSRPSVGRIELASSVTVALVVGFLAGTLFVGSPVPASSEDGVVPAAPDRPPVPTQVAPPPDLRRTARAAPSLARSDSVRPSRSARQTPGR